MACQEKSDIQKKIIDLLKHDRSEGLSITDLMNKYNLSKTTVWHHVHAIELTGEQLNKLSSRKGGSNKRYLLALNKAQNFAADLLKGSQRELVIYVTMLYWAEGHKKDFVFTNTDERMLRLYLLFLHNIFNIDSKNLNILIRTSDPIISNNAIEHWATIFRLTKNAFSVNHDNIQNKTKTKFGICRVMVAKSSFYHKVMLSLISLAQEELNKPL